jgi:hypothetical protein
MKFTFLQLMNQNKVVPMALLPEKANDKFTWQIDDTDVLEYDPKTKQFSLEVYDFIDDDYELIKTLRHDEAYQVALQNNIVY